MKTFNNAPKEVQAQLAKFKAEPSRLEFKVRGPKLDVRNCATAQTTASNSAEAMRNALALINKEDAVVIPGVGSMSKSRFFEIWDKCRLDSTKKV